MFFVKMVSRYRKTSNARAKVKFHLMYLLLMIALLPACSRQEVVGQPRVTPLPSLPSFPTATRAPVTTDAFAPNLPLTKAPSPSPTCHTVLIPTGFTRDGNHLLSLLNVDGRSGTWLQVLNLQDMIAQTLLKTDGVINVAALSPDGETAAWALPDFSVQLIRLPDGKITATLTGHTAMVNALLFSPDGSQLYSASSDGYVIIWDTKQQARKTSFQPTFNAENLPSEVLGLGISPDGETLVTIPLDGDARTWDTATFKQVGEYKGAISGGYNGAHARYSPDGKFLAIGLSAGPGDTSLWQVADDSKMWSGGMLSTFDFSSDSRLFAHTELDENNHYRIVVRSEDGQTVYRTIPPSSDLLAWGLIFSPDGSTLVLTDGTIRLWNVSDGSLQNTYTAPCP